MKYLLSLLLFASSAHASDWTEADTFRQEVVITTFVLDYAQTKDIINHPKLHEINPLLPLKPSENRTRNYFIAASVIHTAIAYNLRPEWRRNFQYATIALEVVTIVHNRKIGLKYDF